MPEQLPTVPDRGDTVDQIVGLDVTPQVPFRDDAVTDVEHVKAARAKHQAALSNVGVPPVPVYMPERFKRL